MKLKEIIEPLNFEVLAGADSLDNDITGGYASDLLSDVLANAGEGNIWITLHIHQNIVGVANLKDLSGIILINGRVPEEDTLEKAEKEGIPIVGSSLPAFELIGKLYSMGISGITENVE